MARAMTVVATKNSNDQKRDWRAGSAWWSLVVVLNLAIAVVISYEVWIWRSLLSLTEIKVYEISVVKLGCSAEHFWGEAINFKYPNDDTQRYGVVCRDWVNEKWVLR